MICATNFSIAYTYDGGHSSTNRSRGSLTQVKYSNSSYQKDLTYNSLGLLASAKVTISGGASGGYTTAYSYDTYQRLSQTTYPDGDVATIGYNSRGMHSTLSSSISGTLVDSTVYDAEGRLTRLRFPAGGNLYRTQSYCPWTGSANNTNGRLKEIKVGTTDGAQDRLYFLYGYDSFGNIGGLSEKYNNGALTNYTISYDNQNRLTGAFGKTYAYRNDGRLSALEGATLANETTVPHPRLQRRQLHLRGARQSENAPGAADHGRLCHPRPNADLGCGEPAGPTPCPPSC